MKKLTPSVLSILLRGAYGLYLISYIAYKGEEVNDPTFYHVTSFSVSTAALAGGQLITAYVPLTRARFAAFCGSCCVILSVVGFMFIPTLWSLLIFMSLTFGTGVGIMYFAPLYFYLDLHPYRKGLISGLVSFFFGLAKIMWTPIARHMVNPDNLEPDSRGLFPNSVAVRAPQFLRLVVYITLGLDMLGLFLLYHSSWKYMWKTSNSRGSRRDETNGGIGSALYEKEIRNSNSSSAVQNCDDGTTFSASTKGRCNVSVSTTSGAVYRSKNELEAIEMRSGMNSPEWKLDADKVGEMDNMQLSEHESVHEKPEAMSPVLITASVLLSLAFCFIKLPLGFLVGNYKPIGLIYGENTSGFSDKNLSTIGSISGFLGAAGRLLWGVAADHMGVYAAFINASLVLLCSSLYVTSAVTSIYFFGVLTCIVFFSCVTDCLVLPLCIDLAGNINGPKIYGFIVFPGRKSIGMFTLHFLLMRTLMKWSTNPSICFQFVMGTRCRGNRSACLDVWDHWLSKFDLLDGRVGCNWASNFCCLQCAFGEEIRGRKCSTATTHVG